MRKPKLGDKFKFKKRRNDSWIYVDGGILLVVPDSRTDRNMGLQARSRVDLGIGHKKRKDICEIFSLRNNGNFVCPECEQLYCPTFTEIEIE